MPPLETDIEDRDRYLSFGHDEEEAWADGSLPDTRHGARQLALRALYWETSQPGEVDRALTALGPRLGLSSDNLSFATRLAHAALGHREELESRIEAVTRNWRRERLARIDALILRLAAAEIIHFDEIPVKVSIDEAVELAHAYGTEQSYGFVNGVLDGLARLVDSERSL